MLVNVLILLSFIAISLATFALMQFLLGRHRDPIRERLERAIAAERDEDAPPEEQPELFGPLTSSLAGQIPQLAFEQRGLEQDLRRAGYYRPTARREYLALRNAMTIGCVLITAVLAVLSGPEDPRLTTEIIAVGAIVAALAFGLPRLLLYLQARSRVRRIERGFPDALDMISMCVTGGLGLHAALQRVSRELYAPHPDLAMELTIVRYQAEVSSLGRAFQQFARRIDVPDVISVSSMINQAERLGSNIVSALREYADGMRHSRRQLAEEHANRTGILLLFPLVFLLAPSVFLLLWGPAVLEMRSFFRQETAAGGAFDQLSREQIGAAARAPELGPRVGVPQ